MPILDQDLWLGTQQSLETAIQAEKQASAHFASFTGNQASYFEELQKMIDGQISSIQDGVMVINMTGNLVQGDAGIEALYGSVGYNDLRRAVLKGMTDPAVKAFLLNVGSGGGAVSGVTDWTSLLARVNSVKPVITYTGGMMASAAYWSGSQGRQIYASPTAIVGSIGVVQIHVSRAKALADNGYDVTVVRTGSEKMLANPYERLTEAAKAQMQAQSDALYEVFIESVANARGVSVKAADKKFGQGRVFIGQQAVDVGLVDKLGTFDDAFSRAYALGKGGGKAAPAKKPNVQGAATGSAAAVWQNPNQPEGNDMPNPALSAEMLQAMAAAGIDPNAAPEEDKKPDASAEDKPVTTTASLPAPEAGVAELVAQLAAAQASTIGAKNEAAAAAAALATANASHEAQITALNGQLASAVDIVRDSVRAMGIHFGVSKEGVKALSATEVLAEHGRLRGLFLEKFPVGRVSAAGNGAASGADPVAGTLSFAEREFARSVTTAKK